jgi:hypothetical protein
LAVISPNIIQTTKIQEKMKNKTPMEDRLDGASNFSPWKSKLLVTLEEEDLLDATTKTLPETTTELEKKIRKEDDVRARKIIIYSVRDHLLPRIANLKTAYDMYKTLKEMFESDNTLRALALRSQLQSTKMTKDDTVALFFMKLSEVKEQLETIGENMSDRELVLTTLQNLPKSWEPFLQSISGRETLPTFERLWIDCTQEELRLRNRGVEDYPEENHALALHTRKGGKFKRNFRQTFKEEKPSSNSGYQRRDPSKTLCYRCDKHGHIAKYCPTRKKGKQYATTADIDPDPPQENEERRNEKYFL